MHCLTRISEFCAFQANCFLHYFVVVVLKEGGRERDASKNSAQRCGHLLQKSDARAEGPVGRRGETADSLQRGSLHGRASISNMAEKHGLSDYSSGYAQGGYENGPFKRQKVEMGGYGGSQGGGYRQSSSSDPHFAEPSPVIHVRGVANDAREQDLLHLLSPYGQIRYAMPPVLLENCAVFLKDLLRFSSCITMMPKIRQALVEFTVSHPSHSSDCSLSVAYRNRHVSYGRSAYFLSVKLRPNVKVMTP